MAQLMQFMQQQMQQANTPDPQLQSLLGLNQSVLNWHTNPNNTVKDIYKHPTLGGKLPVFQMAKKNLDAGRIGRGVVGRTMANSQYGADMKLEDDFNRSITASGMLEQGLQGEMDDAQNNIAQLLDLDYSRKSGQAGNITGILGAYKNLKGSGGGWGGFLRGLAGGAMSSI